MRINKIKINSYGKLKDKEIELKDGLNIVYGQNEAGKSTLINFIISSLYGISKNKKGKEISDYDKYKPWNNEEFSGKLDYQLDDKTKYEIFRDFNKKNPKIFNENKEDISKEFNIDKTKGNEFFLEQTKIDQDLFLSTLAINQMEVKLEGNTQNILIQKIANLAQTGDDSIAFKIILDRINRKQLDEVGTDRTREKPINVVNRKIENLTENKLELEKYKDLKYEFEDRENDLNKKLEELSIELEYLKAVKILLENERLEKEKINTKEEIKKDQKIKIENLTNKINEISNTKKDNVNSKKKINKLDIILATLIIINILEFIIIKNKYFKYIFFVSITTLIVYILFYILNKVKLKNINKKERQIIKKEISKMLNEKEMIKSNIENIENEITKLDKELKENIELEYERLRRDYKDKIKVVDFGENDNLKDINIKIDNLQGKINGVKLELHSLELDKKNIEPKIDNLAKIEEELLNSKNQLQELNNLSKSINLAKENLILAYEKMKNSVTPKFTENLSKAISKITSEKYNKVIFNEEEGLIVELPNGDCFPVNRFSLGTIDQLYLSLRLSMIDELTQEKIPILLDEAFAFYDDERLENILKYLLSEFNGRQVIIFTCTNREKDILEKANINFNYIKV